MRFMLQYRGAGPKPDEIPALVAAQEEVRITDRFDNSYVVEGSRAAIKHLISLLGGWLSAPVRAWGRPKIGPARYGTVHRAAVTRPRARGR